MTIFNIKENIIQDQILNSNKTNQDSNLFNKKNNQKLFNYFAISLIFGIIGFVEIIGMFLVNSNAKISIFFSNKISINIFLIGTFTLFFVISCFFGSKAWESKITNQKFNRK